MKNERHIFTSIAILSFVSILYFGCDMSRTDIPPNVDKVSDLDDPKVREAVFEIALDESDLVVQQDLSGENIHYASDDTEPYTGWVKNIRKLQQFQNGKKHGIYISWYGNWEKVEQGYFKNGIRDGLWIQWSPNGEKENEGAYKDGRRDGLWTLWDSDGKKISEITYQNGRVTAQAKLPKGNNDANLLDKHTDDNAPVAYRLRNRGHGNVKEQQSGDIIRRFGKGEIKDIAYSPDGTFLAVATAVGIWVYDGKTGEEIGVPAYIDSVSSIAFSPDGKYIVSGSQKVSINLWETTTGRQIWHTKKVGSTVEHVSYSADGQRILSVNVNSAIDLWNANTGERETSITGNITAFRPDGGMYVTVNGSDLRISDAYTGESIESMTLKSSGVRRLHFSPDGDTIACHNEDSTVSLLYLPTKLEKKLAAELIPTADNTISFSPDGQTLATGSAHGTISLWDVGTGEQKRTFFGHKYGISSVTFSPDGDALATGDESGTIHVWDVFTGQNLKTFIHPETENEITYRQVNRPIGNLLFSPDGTTLVSHSEKGGIRFWDLNSGVLKKEHIGYYRVQLQSLAISPNSDTVASGGNDDFIRLWNTRTGQLMRTLTQGNLVSSLMFSADGSTLVSGCWSGKIRFWNPLTGQLKHQIIVQMKVADRITCISYSPDDALLAIGIGNGDIQIWNVSTRELKSVLKGHKSDVYSVAFSPDGKTLASGERDKRIILWDVQSRTLISSLEGHTHYVSSVLFSLDGKMLISGSWDKTIRFWDAHSGEYIKNIATWDCIDCLAISPDGNTLAGSGVFNRLNNTVDTLLWDIETGQEKQTLSGHTGGISEIAFSTDGNTLASTGDDGTVVLWDVSSVTK